MYFPLEGTYCALSRRSLTWSTPLFDAPSISITSIDLPSAISIQISSKGLKLNLKGDANDYVGKGLSGATISIKLSDESNLVSNENTIIGNTVLYGATSGKLFAAGQAGDRFAVRNSGAITVIEGCDSNGCEYMTGGTVIILGQVGDNFAAGMTGGMAFIYDIS